MHAITSTLIVAMLVPIITTSMAGQFKEGTNAPDSIAARNFLWVPFDGSTMGVQAACGLGFAGVGIAVGVAASPHGSDASGVQGGLALMLGAAIASFGLPEGIYLGGKWMGGNGNWWATAGGCIAGGLLALVPNIFIKYGDTGVTAVVFGVGALAGGITAYNLSASPIEGGNRAATSFLRPGPSVEKGMLVRITIVSIRL